MVSNSCCVFLQDVPARAKSDESRASRLLLPAWAQFRCFSLRALLCSQMGINGAKLFRSHRTNTHCRNLISIWAHCTVEPERFRSTAAENSHTHPPTYYHILTQYQSCSMWALHTVIVWASMNAVAGTAVMESNEGKRVLNSWIPCQQVMWLLSRSEMLELCKTGCSVQTLWRSLCLESVRAFPPQPPTRSPSFSLFVSIPLFYFIFFFWP